MRTKVLWGLVLVALLAPPAVAHHGDKHAPYDVPVAELEAATQCRSVGGQIGGFEVLNGSGVSEPVLLTHGAGVTREENWSWSWWPWLTANGFEACWLQSPMTGYLDMQTTAEYVAHAVRRMAEQTGEQVDLVGHSQGGLIPRWAIRWFAAGAAVDDAVSFATPHHGAIIFDVETAPGQDWAGAWQMRQQSAFLGALNKGDETPGGADYTSLYTAFDELVQPVGTQALEGASNILVQDVCPGRPTDHFLMAGDAVVHRLALDALVHDGPADVGRAGVDCTALLMPGASAPPGLYPYETPLVDGEPALRPYTQPKEHGSGRASLYRR